MGVLNQDCKQHDSIQCQEGLCDEGYIYSKYVAINGESNFYESIKICQQNNMSPARIRSKKETEMVDLTIKKVEQQWHIHHLVNSSSILTDDPENQYRNLRKSHHYWVGGKKAEGYPGGHANSFFWMNAEGKLETDLNSQLSSTYTNWETNEPNDSGGEDCVSIYDRAQNNLINNKEGYKWIDLNCYLDRTYYEGIGVLCELPNHQCFKDETFRPEINKPPLLRYHFFSSKRKDGTRGCFKFL